MLFTILPRPKLFYWIKTDFWEIFYGVAIFSAIYLYAASYTVNPRRRKLKEQAPLSK
jgi:hypothetical protein